MFELIPDLVATNTSAGISLVEKPADVKAMNVANPASHQELYCLIKEKLHLGL